MAAEQARWCFLHLCLYTFFATGNDQLQSDLAVMKAQYQTGLELQGERFPAGKKKDSFFKNNDRFLYSSSDFYEVFSSFSWLIQHFKTLKMSQANVINARPGIFLIDWNINHMKKKDLSVRKMLVSNQLTQVHEFYVCLQVWLESISPQQQYKTRSENCSVCSLALCDLFPPPKFWKTEKL